MPFLGEIPIDPRVAECGDQGDPIVHKYPDSGVAKAYQALAATVIEQLRLADKGRGTAGSAVVKTRRRSVLMSDMLRLQRGRRLGRRRRPRRRPDNWADEARPQGDDGDPAELHVNLEVVLGWRGKVRN